MNSSTEMAAAFAIGSILGAAAVLLFRSDDRDARIQRMLKRIESRAPGSETSKNPFIQARKVFERGSRRVRGS